MSCSVLDCTKEPTTVADLDPQKVGGWSSYPYQVPLCAAHDREIAAGVPWVCRDDNGHGPWVVLVGDQIAGLNKFIARDENVQLTSGEMSWRSTDGLIPPGPLFRIPVDHIGGRSDTTLDLYLAHDQAVELARKLELHLRMTEGRGQQPPASPQAAPAGESSELGPF